MNEIKTVKSIILNRSYELQMEYDSKDDSYDSPDKECYSAEILARMDECNQILKELESLQELNK